MFAKNYYLHWIAGRANVLSKEIIYIFFNFGHGYCGSFPLCFYIYELKKCLRLLKSYFKLEILICLSYEMSFLVNMFN